MNIKVLILAFMVSFLNISLNTLMSKAAKAHNSYYQALWSSSFLYSFFLGIGSLLFLLAVYTTGISLARGILLMGAISILGGSLFGVLYYKHTLHNVEWLIFFLLLILLLYRWFYK